MEPGSLTEALRTLRTSAQVSTRVLAERLGWSQARVSRLETGRTRISVEDVAAWADATGADAETKARLIAEAERAVYTVRPWKTVHSEGLSVAQRDIARIESAMTGLRNFQCALIPGLLQTAAYAQRDLEIADVAGRGGVAEAVAARMRRQEVLYDPGRSFEFVLTQGAVHPYFPVTPQLARSQADRLISAMTLPNVSIAVVPYSAHPEIPYLSSFTIFEVPEDPVVLVEIMSAELLLGGEWDVSLYRDTFSRFRSVAVTGEEAVELIRQELDAVS